MQQNKGGLACDVHTPRQMHCLIAFYPKSLVTADVRQACMKRIFCHAEFPFSGTVNSRTIYLFWRKLSRRITRPYQVHSESHAKKSDSSRALGTLARRESSHLHDWEKRHWRCTVASISLFKLLCSFETLRGEWSERQILHL